MSKKGPWLIHFFKRHKADDSAQALPGREFLDACPTAVRAKLIAIITAVADAPPPMFSGGGKWEAMHDVGLGGPSIVIISGMRKPFKTTFTKKEYEAVRALGLEYFTRNPRSVA